MALCLGKPADIYLIDEPSAYLDSEQRLVCAKVIKRFILHAKKTAFVVEHDFIMATYLADHVVVFDGTPSIKTMASSPQTLLTGTHTHTHTRIYIYIYIHTYTDILHHLCHKHCCLPSLFYFLK